jgi:hypothetical protein
MPYVNTANSKTQAQGESTIKLRIKYSNKDTSTLTLENILYLPSSLINFLSTRSFLLTGRAMIDNKLLSAKDEKKKDQVILIRRQTISYSSALIAYVTSCNSISRS